MQQNHSIRMKYEVSFVLTPWVLGCLMSGFSRGVTLILLPLSFILAIGEANGMDVYVCFIVPMTS